ncbi:hypothetical protein Hanom_Chr11g00993981 [Helianthus anomalus]
MTKPHIQLIQQTKHIKLITSHLLNLKDGRCTNSFIRNPKSPQHLLPNQTEYKSASSSKQSEPALNSLFSSIHNK